MSQQSWKHRRSWEHKGVIPVQDWGVRQSSQRILWFYQSLDLRVNGLLFSCSVVSSSLQPNGLQHARLPWPLPSPGACSNYVHWVGDAIQPSCPLSSPSTPAFNFPSIRVFSNESVLRMRWPKYWSFSFSISPFNEYSGLISFRTGWSDLLAVQGTLKSPL